MIKSFTSTKEKLLIILKKSNESSMKEIMEHFDLSEIAIRRHLRDLIREQLVIEESVKQNIGRPYKVYRLTSKGHEMFPNQYKQLPLEFLNDIEELHGEEAINELLNKRKERENTKFLSKLTSDEFDERIKQLTDIQSKSGYLIELNEVEDGYEIINYNCPIYNVASSYIKVCSNEKETLEKIFPNSEVKSHSKISEGDTCCKWTIYRPKSE